jgi:hypothetical protein
MLGGVMLPVRDGVARAIAPQPGTFAPREPRTLGFIPNGDMYTRTLKRSAAMLGCIGALALALGGEASAACPVRSAYDVTVMPDRLVFERSSGTARRIEMRGGVLSDQGKPIALAAADRDRVVRFERVARSVLPRIRRIGARAVDLMVVAVREEAAATSPKSAANPQLNARLDARAAAFKSRIAQSNSSKEWRGNAFNRYAAEALTDVVPLIGGDLGQQALDATMRGEFSRAAALGERAAGIRSSLEARVRQRLAALQPDMDDLCPALRQLDALEKGVRAPLADGTRLDLLEVGS